MHIYKGIPKGTYFYHTLSLKEYSFACNRLFSPLKPTISKPLAWDYEHGDLILST
jgi:hypothetical protein